MKRHWLITSFDPFAGRPVNNSKTVQTEIDKLVQDLEKTSDWNFKFHYHVLPVEYDRCFTVLKKELERLAAAEVMLEGILALGEGAEEFKLEFQANNLDDIGNFPDNAGVARENKKIITEPGAPDVLPLRFPFEAFSRIRKSVNPGYYVCNHLCARAAHAFANDPKQPYFGFIHVPRTGEGGIFTADVCGAMIVNAFKKIPA